jgi:hypothetical protein
MALRDTSWVIDTGGSLQFNNALLVADSNNRVIVELVGGGGTYIHRTGGTTWEWIALTQAAAVAAKAAIDDTSFVNPFGDSIAFSVGHNEANRVLGAYTLYVTKTVESWAEVVET